MITWEREYFHCAGIWLACRLETMTGRTWQHPKRTADLEFALLGEHDYWQEMRRILAEQRIARKDLTAEGAMREQIIAVMEHYRAGDCIPMFKPTDTRT